MENSFGARTTHLYNAEGHVSASVNPLGARSSIVFDAAGRQVARVNPLGARVTSLFDAVGQMVAMVNPLGFRTTFSFDAAGRQVVTTDANGHSSTTTYDSAGRTVASQNALGHRTTSILDSAGQFLAVQDARGNLWSFTYDPAGMRTQQIDPLGRITTSGYDAAGQQLLRIDARGNPTTYSFDPVGQLTRRWYPDNTRATFLFDAVGNRTGMRDTTGVYTYVFDALNQFASVNQSSVGIITYSFDALGRRRSMIAPTGGYFTYAYDPANRLGWMSNPEGDRTTFSYDVADRRTLKELANGTRASFTYDTADQILQLFNLKSDDSLISGFTYAMDAVGNRTSVLEGTGDRVTWTYDRTNQLTSEHRSGAHAYFHTFLYDPVGNRLLKLEDGAAATYTYNAANQLESSTDTTGQMDYHFDANGNQQIVVDPSGARTTWTWDHENQPTMIELPSGDTVTIGYNSNFRRAFEMGNASSTLRFVWDYSNDSYLVELDSAGNVLALYTNEPVHFGVMASQHRSDITHWMHSDGLGSIRQLTTTAEAISDTYLYAAWGSTLATFGATSNPFRWVGAYGYYEDPATRFHYVRRRLYVAPIGKWLSADPAGFIEGTNLYTYAANNPISFMDVDGWQTRYTPGRAICAGLPAGMLCILSRGAFSLLWLRDYVPETEGWLREVPRVGSAMTARWRPNPQLFVDPRGCCCCDSIGFVQIESTSSAYRDKPITGSKLGKWYVDGGIPYIHSTTVNPCQSNPQSIELRDQPNAPEYFRGFGSRLRSLRQQFWTCVVCLRGNERYRWTLSAKSYGDVPAFGWSVTGITVYGCYSWGHEFLWSNAKAAYVYRRFINNVSEDGRRADITLTGVLGVCPPAHWWDTVKNAQNALIKW